MDHIIRRCCGDEIPSELFDDIDEKKERQDLNQLTQIPLTLVKMSGDQVSPPSLQKPLRSVAYEL